MTEPNLGLLGFISEAAAIKDELGVSTDEAYEIQRERFEARQAAREAAESNVIQFRPRS